MTFAQVIGVGQPFAGDDGVGRVVLAALRSKALPEGTTLCEVAEPSQLIELLPLSSRTIVVDAVLQRPPGSVGVYTALDLDEAALASVSTHGLSVGQCLALSKTLHPGLSWKKLWVVAIGIDAPREYRQGLSPEVAKAVPRAVERIEELLEGTIEFTRRKEAEDDA